MVSAVTSADAISFNDDEAEVQFEIPVEILDQEWLQAQVDKAPTSLGNL